MTQLVNNLRFQWQVLTRPTGLVLEVVSSRPATGKQFEVVCVTETTVLDVADVAGLVTAAVNTHTLAWAE